MATKQTNWTLIGVLGFVFAVLVIAVSVFLFSKGEAGLTGLQVINNEPSSFWTWAIVLGIVGIAAVYVAVVNDSGAGAIGSKLPGSMGLTIVLLIVAIICIFGPYAKACNDKVESFPPIEKVAA